MRRRLLRAAAAMVVTATCLVVAIAPAPHAAAHPDRGTPSVAAAQDAGIELVAQTPTVPRNGTFTLRVRLDGVPAEGSIRLVLHDRVRSRSELEASIDGNALRRQLLGVVIPISELATAPDGSRSATLSFDPATPTGIRLSASGAYPLEVIATDAALTPVDQLITHVIAEPAEEDESPALSVALVAQLGAPPASDPGGEVALAGDLAGERALVDALAAVPGVAATLAVVPETVEALLASGEPDHLALLDALRAAAVDRSVLARPYVDVSVEALAARGLGEQLDALMSRGELVLRDSLGAAPDRSSWLAEPDLAEAGLDALEELGVEHVVVHPDQLEPVSSGTLALSPARPFLLTPPGERAEPSPLDALAVDPRLEERIDDRSPDAALAHRLLAELAVLWLEQPGVNRGVVLPVDASFPAATLEVLLQGLEDARMFDAVTLAELFDDVDTMLDAAGSPLDRALDPEATSSLSRQHAAALQSGWQGLATLQSLLGPNSPRTAEVLDHLLLATAADLRAAEREAHLDAAATQVEAVTGAIAASRRTTVTLTARDGTVPLTLRNDAGVPVDVVIHLRSPKLDFPRGESMPLTLTEPMTRLELVVEARASGAFPLDVEVTSPDGRVVLASTRYTVQSTAVSGAGLILSVGAGLFLIVWWARHWRKTRRSAKLIGAAHPSARSVPADAQ